MNAKAEIPPSKVFSVGISMRKTEFSGARGLGSLCRAYCRVPPKKNSPSATTAFFESLQQNNVSAVLTSLTLRNTLPTAKAAFFVKFAADEKRSINQTL